MSMTSIAPAARELLERIEIADTIYRYASCIDRRDLEGVRAVLADDVWARYGNAEPMTGGDTVAGWIDGMTKDCLWQHHLLSVYHVDVDGDRADALVYHTSHQVYRSDPATVNVLVGRYHDELRRDADRWRISRLVFEILWGERRTDATGFLDEVGGRGPIELSGGNDD
jgi:ketosteroid isomerase-like protein